jgi:Uncharacterized protein family UPF0029
MPPQKRSPPSSDPSPEGPPSISSKIEDRSSTFLALYSPTLPLSSLRIHPSLAGATHRIAAWRCPSTQKGIYPGAPPPLDIGWDDDGEAKAGRRVLGVMETKKVQGTLVVGRWWGGIMLGPVRFTHIETVAKAAIEGQREAEDGAGKRRRVNDRDDGGEGERKRREELVKTLATRDEHILILRKLLAEKKEELEKQKSQGAGGESARDVENVGKRGNPDEKATTTGAASAASPSTHTTEAPKPNYVNMPTVTLQRIEQARDKTIGFVLAEIEKVEKELGSDEGAKGDDNATVDRIIGKVDGA